MINVLHIKNIGIIDDLCINLNNGLNVLTGETGAGKTLVIDSINIICGGRFSKDIIRKEQDYSFVEAQIEKDKNNYIVSREINIKGKNICKINGRLVTVAELKKFMKDIIDIHGQYDNLNILNESEQINYLDYFSGNEILNIKELYKLKYEKYINIKNELNANYGDDKEKQRKLDLLKYQYNEIENADLNIDEETELEDELKIINNSEKIYKNINEASIQIENNTIDSLSIAIKNIEKIAEYDKQYEKILEALKSNYYDLEEINRDLQECNNGSVFDEGRKNEISERLDMIYSLKRKYGNDIKEILIYKKEVEKEINKIESMEEYIQKLKLEKSNIEKELLKLSKELNKIRKEKSINLEEKINYELQYLEMKNAKFYVQINYSEKNIFNKNGQDEVKFLIRTNIGEDKKELSQIASGGETSRIMLAIKTILADVDNTSTLIFDEIDTGISGVSADKVGEKLKKVAKNHQILIVTHLANIAAKGEYNYYIYKETDGVKTKTKIELLNEDEKINEIARIASGKITKISLEHAKELIKSKIA